MGSDFRTAYVPGTTLTGAGQTVGLLQFDGYTDSDITYYEATNGLPNVLLTNVLLDDFDGSPSGFGGEVEVSLDIEMVISMAPGVSNVMVYMAGPYGNWYDILKPHGDGQSSQANQLFLVQPGWGGRFGGRRDFSADGGPGAVLPQCIGPTTTPILA